MKACLFRLIVVSSSWFLSREGAMTVMFGWCGIGEVFSLCGGPSKNDPKIWFLLVSTCIFYLLDKILEVDTYRLPVDWLTQSSLQIFRTWVTLLHILIPFLSTLPHCTT
jgi:hypothetical protein